MRYLLDTDAVSEPTRRRPSKRFLSALRAHEDELAISVVTVGEIVYGARRVEHGERFLRYLEDVVLPRMPVLGTDVSIAVRYGELRAALERIGRRLDDLDLIIAATAIEHHLILVTGNVAHFSRVPGLTVESWSLRE